MLATDRQTKDPGFPVIPVLLSVNDPPLGFLSQLTWIDLSGGLVANEQFERLVTAVRQAAGGEPPSSSDPSPRSTVCPYRGLLPFREEDAPFFHGRDRVSDTIAQKTTSEPIVAVIGASGCGKSSVARCGVISRLRRGLGEKQWEFAVITPGDDPLFQLAAALAPLLKPESDPGDQLLFAGELKESLLKRSVTLARAAETSVQLQNGTDRLLLLVDRWEELYTHCQNEGHRRCSSTSSSMRADRT